MLRRLAAALGTGRGGDAVVALVEAERRLAAARAAVAAAPGGAGLVAALRAAESARKRAAAAVEEIAGLLLADAVRFGIDDRRIAKALGVAEVVAAVLTADVRALLPAGTVAPRFGVVYDPDLAVQRDKIDDTARAVEAARTRLGADRAFVELFTVQVDSTVRSGVRWLMFPQGRRPGDEAQLRQVAAALGLPVAVVRAYAADPNIPADVPPAVGATPGRHRSFSGDLALVVAALHGSRAALGRAQARYAGTVEGWNDAVAAHRRTVGDAIAAGLAAGHAPRVVARAVGVPAGQVVPGVPAVGSASGAGWAPAGTDAGTGLTPFAPGAPQLRPRPVAADAASGAGSDQSGVGARGPPGRRTVPAFGARAVLRAAVRGARGQWSEWRSGDRAALAAQAAYRELRDETVAAAGGLVAVLERQGMHLAPAGVPWLERPGAHRAAIAALIDAGRVAADAATEAARLRQEYLDAVTPAVEAAGKAGLPVSAIMRLDRV